MSDTPCKPKPRQVHYRYRCENSRCLAIHHGGSSAKRCPHCKRLTLTKVVTVKGPAPVTLRIAK